MTPDRSNPKRVLSFTDHLEELRVRIFIVLVAFVIFFLAGLYFSPLMLSWLIAPLTHLRQAEPSSTLVLGVDPDGVLRIKSPAALTSGSAETLQTSLSQPLALNRIAVDLPGGQRVVAGPKSRTSLHYLSPVEPFFLLIKGALLISFVFIVPLAIYQLWLFVAPGLKVRERRVIRPVLASSLILFPVGVGFAYFIASFALRALLSLADTITDLEPNIVASEYLSFIMTLMILFGVIFEFPLVLVLLNRMGLVSAAMLAEKRRYAILIIAAFAALFTPPDPFSMVAGILPLLLLYEVSIWIIRVLERRDASTLPAVRQNSV
jgi:sec-independent protein translocase protein TatC